MDLEHGCGYGRQSGASTHALRMDAPATVRTSMLSREAPTCLPQSTVGVAGSRTVSEVPAPQSRTATSQQRVLGVVGPQAIPVAPTPQGTSVAGTQTVSAAPAYRIFVAPQQSNFDGIQLGNTPGPKRVAPNSVLSSITTIRTSRSNAATDASVGAIDRASTAPTSAYPNRELHHQLRNQECGGTTTSASSTVPINHHQQILRHGPASLAPRLPALTGGGPTTTTSRPTYLITLTIDEVEELLTCLPEAQRLKAEVATTANVAVGWASTSDGFTQTVITQAAQVLISLGASTTTNGMAPGSAMDAAESQQTLSSTPEAGRRSREGAATDRERTGTAVGSPYLTVDGDRSELVTPTGVGRSSLQHPAPGSTDDPDPAPVLLEPDSINSDVDPAIATIAEMLPSSRGIDPCSTCYAQQPTTADHGPGTTDTGQIQPDVTAGLSKLAEAVTRLRATDDIPEFDGEGSTTPREFRFRVREFLKHHPHMTHDEGRYEIARRLRGTALEEYRSLTGIESMSPTEVVENLTRAFEFHHGAQLVLPPVYRQREDEPVIKYKVMVEQQAREHFPKNHPARADSDRLLMGLFIGGLRYYLQERVLIERPTTLDEAFWRATKWESLEKASLEARMAARGKAVGDEEDEWLYPRMPSDSMGTMGAVAALQSYASTNPADPALQFPYDRQRPTPIVIDQQGVSWYWCYSFEDSIHFKQWRLKQSNPNEHKKKFYCTRCGKKTHTADNESRCKQHPDHPHATAKPAKNDPLHGSVGIGKRGVKTTHKRRKNPQVVSGKLIPGEMTDRGIRAR